ncbi:hypothetical protein TWF481_006367 [Arthrobotrys musiformis]|uniref:Nephrocystin 3-like N-terminal domain-containing protein n=1 Tax=Arthrobotrys musiformis TaxID=47236 RepID=A0AAV9WGJ2_9PEZI
MEAAASIAGLIALVDLVITKGYRYYSAVKEAKTEIRSLLEETTLLHGALSNLRFTIIRLGEYAIEKELGSIGPFPSDGPGILKDILMTSECMAACQSDLNRLYAALPDFDDLNPSKLSRISHRLGWPFKKDETNKITQSIQRHKNNITLALQTSTISALVSALKGQDSLKDIAEQIRVGQLDTIKRLERIQLNDEKRRALNWASTASPQAAHQNNLKLRHAGTAEWFSGRAEYQRWKNTQGSRLWLSGIPGAGKTIMVSSIIKSVTDDLEDDEAVVFHYCDFKSQDSQALENILCSLIRQSSVQSAAAFEILRNLYHKHHTDESAASFLKDSGVDLIDTLAQISKSYASLIIIIDGLDECINRDELIRQLDQLVNTQPSRIKVLFSSRPEPDIENALFTYDRIEVAASESDVRIYVASVIEDRIRFKKLRLGRPKQGKPDMKSLILDGLVEGCKGMFQWVVCQIDYLCQLGNDTERKDALKNLPPGLNDVYQKILERVTSYGGGNENNKEYLLRLLRWLTFSLAPLTLSEFAEATANIVSGEGFYDEDSILDEDKILELGSSFVRINRETDCLEFSHFTVRDFFLHLDSWSQRPPSLGFYALNWTTDHMWLAKFCLRYMMLKDFQEAYLLPDDKFGDFYNTYPLLNYADCHWDRHARAALPFWDDELRTLVSIFLRAQDNYSFLRWRKTNAIPNVWNWKPDFYTSEFFRLDRTQLFFAAAAGLLSGVEELVQHEDQVNNPIAGGGTPLSAALCRFHEQTNHELSAAGRPENKQWSISHDYDRIILCLLDAGADPNISRGGDLGDPFFAFFQSQKYSAKIAELLFTKLKKPVSAAVVGALCTKIKDRWIKITEVIDLVKFSTAELWDSDRKWKICQALMENGASESEVCYLVDMNKLAGGPNEEGFTIKRSLTLAQEKEAQSLRELISAARSGMSERVNILVSAFPSIVNSRSSEGYSALDTACIHGHETIVRRLLACDQISVNTQAPVSGLSPLHFACSEMHYGCVQPLLDAGADVNLQCANGFTPLSKLWVGFPSMVSLAPWQSNNFSRISEKLLSSKVDFTLKSKQNMTYLHPVCAITPQITKYADAILKQHPSIDIDAQDRHGYTALHYAAIHNNSGLVTLLISRSATVDCRDTYGSTPLMFACRSGASDAVRALIQAGAQVFAKDEGGWQPQHYVCRSPNPEALSLLIRDADNSGSKIAMTTLTKSGATPLHLAVENEDPKVTLKLVEQLLRNPDIDPDIALTDTGCTAFGLAAEVMVKDSNFIHSPETGHSVDSPCAQRLEVLKILLQRTKSPNTFYSDNSSPLSKLLQVACQDCWYQIIFLFKTHPEIGLKAKITADGLTPLHCLLSQEAALSDVRFLLDNDASVTATAPNGCTALHIMLDWPSNRNADNVIRLLCARGADVNARSDVGTTPLMTASKNQKLVFTQILLECGADATLVDSRGRSALNYAIKAGATVELLRTLVNAGVPLENRRRVNGFTPLLQAVRFGDPKAVEFLLGLGEKSINASARDRRRDGIWHVALYSKYTPEIIEIFKKLNVQGRVALNLRNMRGITPLAQALLGGVPDAIVEALLTTGSDIFTPGYPTSQFSCLQLGIKSGRLSTVRLLLKYLPKFDCTVGREVTFDFLLTGSYPQVLDSRQAYNGYSDPPLPWPSNATDFWYQTTIYNEGLHLLLEHHENIMEDDVLLFARSRTLKTETYELIASFIRQGKVYNGLQFTGDATGLAALSSARRHFNFAFCRVLEEWGAMEASDAVAKYIYTGIRPSPPWSSPRPLKPSDDVLLLQVFDAVQLGYSEPKMMELLSQEDFGRLKDIEFNVSLRILGEGYEKGRDINFMPPVMSPLNYWTILHLAADCGNQTAIRCLLFNGCLLNTRDQSGWEVLFYILCRDDPLELESIADFLEGLQLKRDQRVGLRTHHTFPAASGRGPIVSDPIKVHENALHYLARRGAWRCTRILVEKAHLFFKIPDEAESFSVIDLRDSNGATPLNVAVRHGNLNFIKELLKLSRKPDVCMWGPNGIFALKMDALSRGYEYIAEALSDGYPDLKSRGADHVDHNLWGFVQATDSRRLKILLNSGADLNLFDPVQGHAIHCMLSCHSIAALGVILDHMGPERSLSLLTKRASAYGNAFEILGRDGCYSCHEYLDKYLRKHFEPLLPEILEKAMKDGIAAAIDQGYTEFAERLQSTVNRRCEYEYSFYQSIAPPRSHDDDGDDDDGGDDGDDDDDDFSPNKIRS